MEGEVANAPFSTTIAARIDRLPLTILQWRFTLTCQIYWGLNLLLDTLAIRIYPFVWQPAHAFSNFEYTILVGAQNGGGVLIGEYFFTWLADRVGRKLTMCLTCLTSSLFIWPIAYTSNWYLLMLFVSVAAMGVGGTLGLAAVYMSEISSPKTRSRSMLASQCFSALLLTFVGGYPALYLLPSHIKLYVWIFALLPTVVALPLVYFVLPESPRWLEGKGRIAEADVIVTKMETWIRDHRKPLPEPIEDFAVPVVEHVPVREIFEGVYRRRTVVMLCIFVLGYLGLDYGFGSYQIIYLVENHYTGHTIFLISIYAGGAGYLVAIGGGALLGERVERKTWVFIAGLATGIGALGYGFFPSHTPIIVIATFFTSAAVLLWAFNMYNYAAVAYPTRLRAVGTGWTDGLGHVGAMFGPSIAGYFYNLSSSHVAWYLWFAVIGGLVPGFIALIFGMKQSSAVMEQVSQ